MVPWSGQGRAAGHGRAQEWRQCLSPSHLRLGCRNAQGGMQRDSTLRSGSWEKPRQEVTLCPCMGF